MDGAVKICTAAKLTDQHLMNFDKDFKKLKLGVSVRFGTVKRTPQNHLRAKELRIKSIFESKPGYSEQELKRDVDGKWKHNYL